jgi:hypothetical protein
MPLIMPHSLVGADSVLSPALDALPRISPVETSCRRVPRSWSVQGSPHQARRQKRRNKAYEGVVSAYEGVVLAFVLDRMVAVDSTALSNEGAIHAGSNLANRIEDF